METAFARPFKPAELVPSAIKSFSLPSMAQQLMTEKAFEKHGRNGLTLARYKDLTMVLTVAKGGKICQEHKSPGLTTIILLSGSITLSTNNVGQTITLDSGTAAALLADVAHQVKANTDSVFLTVIGGGDAGA